MFSLPIAAFHQNPLTIFGGTFFFSLKAAVDREILAPLPKINVGLFVFTAYYRVHLALEMATP